MSYDDLLENSRVVLKLLKERGSLRSGEIVRLTMAEIKSDRVVRTMITLLRKRGLIVKHGALKSQVPYEITDKGLKFLEGLNTGP